MVKWIYGSDMAAKVGTRMHEPWMLAFASQDGPPKMTVEEKNVTYNLLSGDIAPLIEFLKQPENQMPVTMRLMFIQMLACSEKTDYHLIVKKGSHLGSNEHTTWDQMQARNILDKDVEEIGNFILDRDGNIRGNLKLAIFDASEKFSLSERQVKELWTTFKKERSDMSKKLK
ncbi:hypothetical protein N9W89_10675 [Hellea sp.]|nr:hypothetical protein [Hellea sp.]